MLFRKSVLLILFTLTIILLTHPVYAGVLYVKEGGTGSGTSWADAFSDPQEAIELAAIDTRYSQVWVAGGTYKPISHPNGGTDDREFHFSLRNGVAMYGGFAGNESSLSQRNIETNETILSGDIGSEGIVGDNCYHVFYHPVGTNLDSTAVLDGFTISGGNADGSGNHRRGGGIHNYSSSPTLKNLIISNNRSSGEGAGIYNNLSDPVMTGISVNNNQATTSLGDGGGICNISSNPVLTDLNISNNQAYWGGGIYNDSSSPVLVNVIISSNQASSHGGGMYNRLGSPELTEVIISNNQGSSGGMYNTSSSPSLKDVSIINNQASSAGGGMYNTSSSNPNLKDVIISGNQASSNGGGMYNVSSNPLISNVKIINNQGHRYGGIYNSGGNTILRDVIIADNQATGTSGGGMYNSGGYQYLDNVIINNNQASWHGGGMYNTSGYQYLTNVTISNNQASWNGGGMYNTSGYQYLTNVTVSFNETQDYGGGIYNNGSSPIVENCILWGNTAVRGGDQIENENISSPDISWSIVQGGYPEGTNIFTSNPLLQPLADNGGFTLTHAIPADSPAYAIPESAGGGNWNDAPDTDQRGMPRATSGNRAMGSFEGDINPGALHVTILPEAAATEGGKWRRTGTESWHSSGHTEGPLPLGEHTVEFKDIFGWTTPDNLSVTILEGETAEEERIYTRNQYTVTPSAGNNGSISPDTPQTVTHGDTTTFTVTPDTGYSIANVTGCGGTLSGNTYTTGTITEACTVEALFTALYYTIGADAQPEQGGTVAGDGDYPYGAEATLTATPNAGYSFVNWTKIGPVVSTSRNYTFTVTGHRNLTANFSQVQDEYEITLIADPEQGGSVNGGGTHDHGSEVTVSATPDSGWRFTGWFEDDLMVSSETGYTFTAERDRTLEGRFSRATLPGVLMLLLDDE